MATHIAWVPLSWLDVARATLAGLGPRHPSRTILLVPQPEAGEDRLDAEVSITPLQGSRGGACTEVIVVRLLGCTALAPASVAMPLLVSDLPVFCRWRGQPAFGAPEVDQLVGIVDRLIVDSGEWDGVPAAYAGLADLFERPAVSDIAWARITPWQASLASLWPWIDGVETLGVAGPRTDALLLHAWLALRLGRDVALEHRPAPTVEHVEANGVPVPPPPHETRTASDLLSDELDRFGRDRLYESVVRSLV